MIENIIGAFASPFAETNTWYGIMTALAFRRQIRTLVDMMFETVEGKIPGGSSNGDSN